MCPARPDWQLPPGVNRGGWDYIHSAGVARTYDAGLADSSLFRLDLAFFDEYALGALPQPRSSGRLLDLGCGTGRLLLHAARRGYWCLGVDLSMEMLAVATEKARLAGVEVNLLQASIVELEALADGNFDCAACLFSTLGMVSGADNRDRVLAHVNRVLRPGGRFILHVHNRWFNAGIGWIIGDLVRSWLKGTPGGDRVMPAHQGVAGLTLHVFTRREAVQLLREAGFRIVEVRPISLREDGRLCWPWFFGWLRAYGYLIAAEKNSTP
jgi:ubiquinone/menaquinone biosynthesis C-methylase UbiE